MKVIVSVVNNPLFIRFQYELLKRFMPVSYELIIFNDAKSFPDYSNFNNPNLRDEISELCHNLNITCIDIDNSHHQTITTNASKRHIETLNIMRDFMNAYPDDYIMLDSDMFPIAPIDITKYSKYNCGAVVEQYGEDKTYMWPVLFFMNPTKVPNWDLVNWDLAPGCDTGGASYLWLDKQKLERPSELYFMKHLWSCKWNLADLPTNITNPDIVEFLVTDLRNKDGNFWSEIYDDTFLHYRAGSNWIGEGADIHKMMTTNLEKCLQSVLADK